MEDNVSGFVCDFPSWSEKTTNDLPQTSRCSGIIKSVAEARHIFKWGFVPDVWSDSATVGGGRNNPKFTIFSLFANVSAASFGGSPSQTPSRADCEENLSPPNELCNTAEGSYSTSTAASAPLGVARTCRVAALSCPRTPWWDPALKCPAANHSTGLLSM